MEVRIQPPRKHQGPVCRKILEDLPEWFGIESAREDYIREVDRLPTLVATRDGEAVGLMALYLHSPQSAELYVLGVLRRFHRQGIGRQLLAASEAWLKEQGLLFLQVKTLAPQADDENYDRTRHFYESAGFVPLEVFPDLWDEHNPCLQMIKTL